MAMHPDLAANLGWLATMTWEGQAFFGGRAPAVDPPRGAATNQTFEEWFVSRPSGLGLWGQSRITDAAPSGYIDLIFVGHWGDTGQSQVTWAPAEVHGPVTMPHATKGLATVTDFRNPQPTPHVGHGQANGVRVRILFTGPGVWEVVDYANDIEYGPYPPFNRDLPRPPWLLDNLETRESVLRRQMGIEAHVDAPPFHANNWIAAFQGTTGVQDRFGADLLSVDRFCDPVDPDLEASRERQLHNLTVRPRLYAPCHFIEPDGRIWNPLVPPYDKLALWKEGFHSASIGTPWFEKFSKWTAKDLLRTGEEWENAPWHHWGVNDICTYYLRTKDPLAWRAIRFLEAAWLAYHEGSRGTSRGHIVNGARDRGRPFQAGVMIWHCTQNEDLRQVLLGNFDESYANWVASRGSGPLQESAGYYSPWMHSLLVLGLQMLRGVDGVGATRQAQIDEWCTVLFRFDLLCWALLPSGKWEMAYRAKIDGSLWVDGNGNPSNYEDQGTAWWGSFALAWGHYHARGSLTSAESAKLTAIIDQRVGGASGQPDQWQDFWKWLYVPPASGTVVNQRGVPQLRVKGHAGAVRHDLALTQPSVPRLRLRALRGGAQAATEVAQPGTPGVILRPLAGSAAGGSGLTQPSPGRIVIRGREVVVDSRLQLVQPGTPKLLLRPLQGVAKHGEDTIIRQANRPRLVVRGIRGTAAAATQVAQPGTPVLTVAGISGSAAAATEVAQPGTPRVVLAGISGTTAAAQQITQPGTPTIVLRPRRGVTDQSTQVDQTNVPRIRLQPRRGIALSLTTVSQPGSARMILRPITGEASTPTTVQQPSTPSIVLRPAKGRVRIGLSRAIVLQTLKARIQSIHYLQAGIPMIDDQDILYQRGSSGKFRLEFELGDGVDLTGARFRWIVRRNVVSDESPVLVEYTGPGGGIELSLAGSYVDVVADPQDFTEARFPDALDPHEYRHELGVVLANGDSYPMARGQFSVETPLIQET